jgi:cell fate (sporulation/competence/biofilm development) regulator YmcA (YheA/YmcA/DUF963 family)
MGALDWPFKLTFNSQVYTLFSQGYYNRKHYWSKSLKNIGGVLGVWLHDELMNGGIARLINREPLSILGVSPSTSWVVYSRAWTPDEEGWVVRSINNITAKYPNPLGTIPFAHLGSLLNLSADGLQTEASRKVDTITKKIANTETVANYQTVENPKINMKTKKKAARVVEVKDEEGKPDVLSSNDLRPKKKQDDVEEDSDTNMLSDDFSDKELESIASLDKLLANSSLDEFEPTSVEKKRKCPAKEEEGPSRGLLGQSKVPGVVHPCRSSTRLAGGK